MFNKLLWHLEEFCTVTCQLWVHLMKKFDILGNKLINFLVKEKISLA